MQITLKESILKPKRNGKGIVNEIQNCVNCRRFGGGGYILFLNVQNKNAI